MLDNIFIDGEETWNKRDVVLQKDNENTMDLIGEKHQSFRQNRNKDAYT